MDPRIPVNGGGEGRPGIIEGVWFPILCLGQDGRNHRRSMIPDFAFGIDLWESKRFNDSRFSV